MTSNNFPPPLPETGKGKALHAWLNRLMEAAKAGRISLSHNVKHTTTPGVSTVLESGFGEESSNTDNVPRWG